MAVRFDAAGDRAVYTAANPPPPGSGITLTAWAYLSVDRNDFSTLVRLHTGSTTVITWATNADGTRGPQYFTASGETGLADGFTVGAWRRVAISCSGTTGRAYTASAAGVVETHSNTVGVGIPTGLTVGGRGPTDTAEWFNGRLALLRVWSAELTQLEIETEWASPTPVRTANAWANWPLSTASDLTDTVAGRVLVPVTGPLTTEDGPPLASPNTSQFFPFFDA